MCEHDDIPYIVKSQHDLKVVNALLSPIGLRCTWNLFECAVFQENQLAIVTMDDYCTFGATFSCPEILLHMLMTKILNFLFTDSSRAFVKNPYFGCNSLEEALVKSDLIGDRIEQDI